MSEENKTCSCECGGVDTKVCLPLKTCLHIKEGEGGGERIWESDWFHAYTSLTHIFRHNLNLESPWLCKPSIVCEGYIEGWIDSYEEGSIRVPEYGNTGGYNVNPKMDTGWAISLARDTCHVSFGYWNYAGVNRSKLVIRY